VTQPDSDGIALRVSRRVAAYRRRPSCSPRWRVRSFEERIFKGFMNKTFK